MTTTQFFLTLAAGFLLGIGFMCFMFRQPRKDVEGNKNYKGPSPIGDEELAQRARVKLGQGL